MDENTTKQSCPVMMPVELFAQATTNPLSPSDLMIASTAPAPAGQESDIASTIALARINRLPLLHWMLAAVNSVLAGEEPAQARPAGIMLECGQFVTTGHDVWAHDWYGHGRRCLVARCVDVACAEKLRMCLNRLLRPLR